MSVRECEHESCIKGQWIKCRVKYNRERRQRLRKLGYSCRVSEERSLKGWARHVESAIRYHKLNPDKRRIYGARNRAKNKELYGGGPYKNWAARVKWMEAREARND